MVKKSGLSIFLSKGKRRSSETLAADVGCVLVAGSALSIELSVGAVEGGTWTNESLWVPGH